MSFLAQFSFLFLSLFFIVTSSTHFHATCNTNILPLPFTTPLSNTSEPSSEITILQYLLQRFDSIHCNGATLSSGTFDTFTQTCVEDFQATLTPPVPNNALGIFDRQTAQALLLKYSNDNYRDEGQTASSLGYLYKILIPVHRNRSIQPNATFLDGENNILFHFPVRAKGHIADGCGRTIATRWPNFNNTGIGLNMYSSGGMTPTGLIEIDPNSPESNASEFGPYPITRFVRGLKGNAKFLLPKHRNGILIHTGEWQNFSNWKAPEPMPNSAGCVHTWENYVAKIWKTVKKLGAKIRNNTNGQTPYPYKCQGLASVFMID